MHAMPVPKREHSPNSGRKAKPAPSGNVIEAVVAELRDPATLVHALDRWIRQLKRPPKATAAAVTDARPRLMAELVEGLKRDFQSGAKTAQQTAELAMLMIDPNQAVGSKEDFLPWLPPLWHETPMPVRVKPAAKEVAKRSRAGYVAPTRDNKKVLKTYVDEPTQTAFKAIAELNGTTSEGLLRDVVTALVEQYQTPGQVNAAAAKTVERYQATLKKIALRLVPGAK